MKIKTSPKYSPYFTALLADKEYIVLGIEDGIWYRVLNEHAEPMLYWGDYFEITDSEKPKFWEATRPERNGLIVEYPPEWLRHNFFKFYFMGLRHEYNLFWKTYKRRYLVKKSKKNISEKQNPPIPKVEEVLSNIYGSFATGYTQPYGSYAYPQSYGSR